MKPLAVIAQSPPGDDHVSRALCLSAEAALASSLPLYRLPCPFGPLELAAVLARVPDGAGAPICYSGYLPHWGSYFALDWQLRDKGFRPLNSRHDVKTAMDFENWYPRLRGLTAASVIVKEASDLDAAAALGFPLFLKGPVKSRKEEGFEACLVRDEDALRAAFDAAKARSRDERLVVRTLLPLKRSGEERNGFPVSREYRVYLYQGDILGYGYYWGGKDHFPLAASERQELLNLAQEAAHRLAVPLVAVDVGQLDSGEWKLVEVGDPQFSGLAHMNRTTFWTRLRERVEA
jgi:hypothetical protein